MFETIKRNGGHSNGWRTR